MSRGEQPDQGQEEALGVTSRELSSVRDDLRRLGYLDHQVERYLLQDVMKGERPLATLLHLSAKVGVLIGLPLALMLALVLATANGLLWNSPFDLIPLFLHLLPLTLVGLGIGFWLPAGLLALFLRTTHLRRIEGVSLGLAMVAATSSVLLALQQVSWDLFSLPRSQGPALAVLLPVFAFLVFKVVHGGLLSLAIRLTRLAPEQPSSQGRWAVVGLLLVTCLLMVPAFLAVELRREGVTGSLPVTQGRPVAVIGMDGVIPQELDYLLATDELADLRRIVDAGAVADYLRPDQSPIAFWTTVATGMEAGRHGLESLDTFRPKGVSRPLRRSGWFRHYWRFGVGVGLVEYRPVLAANRRAWSFWELAGRGGAQSLVVGWWGTFPVEPIAGTVVAHGGYRMLVEDSNAAVHPASLEPELKSRADSADLPEGLSRALGRTVPEAGVDRLMTEVLRPDAFYASTFRDLWRRQSPRVGALYLSALDIVAGKAPLGRPAEADLLRWQLRKIQAVVADLLAQDVAVVLVADPGREGEGRGRAFFLNVEGCVGSEGEVSPEQIGATIMRMLGLPQSRELPEPAEICRWPAPSMRLESFGERPAGTAEAAEQGEEYLENLKSLGYL